MINVIETKETVQKKKSNQKKLLFVVLGMLLISILSIHFAVMPLDTIVYKILFKLGLG